MRQIQLDQLKAAVDARPQLLAELLRNPAEALSSLGLTASPEDVRRLAQAGVERHVAAREHDETQGRSTKHAVFFPVVATLPSKQKRKAPKVPKPRKPAKP